MDPCSLICTAITIGGAGIAAGRNAKTLCRAVRDVKMFEDVINRIAGEFETFEGAIRMTKFSLMATTQKFPKLQIAKWVNEEGLARRLESMSQDIIKEMKAFTVRFNRARKQGLLAFAKKLLWAFFHREDGEKLYPRMQLLSNYFITVLQGVQLEVLLISPAADSPEIREQL
jgi:hypothetical protein